MTSEDRVQRLEHEVADLRQSLRDVMSVISQLRNQPGFPTDGRQFALKFPTLIVGPNGTRYSVVRVATTGHLSTVAAPAVKADWSDV